MTDPIPKQTLAVLGAGKMGGALVRGWVAAGVLAGPNIRLYDTHHAAADTLAAETGATVALTAAEAARNADLLLVSVKPHIVLQSLAEVKEALPPHCLVLSVAPGILLAHLEAAVPPGTPVIRTMPNTPALVGVGATAFCRGTHATDNHAVAARTLFEAVGRAVEVEERLMDAVTGLSGSGPAYIYLIIEALADGGVRAGLPRDVAQTLAAQTAFGAAKMVLETSEHTAVLKDAVTTPAGTTITGLAVLEEAGLRGTLMKAVCAAAERAREMGK